MLIVCCGRMFTTYIIIWKTQMNKENMYGKRIFFLRQNSHKIKFTIWPLWSVHVQLHASSTFTVLWNHHLSSGFKIFSSLERRSVPLAVTVYFLLHPPATGSISMDLPILDIAYKWNHTIYDLFLSCSFHLAWCFQSSFMLQHVSVLHSFLWPNNILYYGYISFSPQIPLTCTRYSVQLRNRFWLHKITLIWEFPVTTA